MGKKNFIFYILLIVIAAFFILCVFILNHRARIVDRLILAGGVSSDEQVELIYSTGYLRDNIHLFKVPTKISQIDASRELDQTDPLDERLIEDAKRFIGVKASVAVNWAGAKFYEMRGKNILSVVTVVKIQGDYVYVILRVF